MGKLSGLVTFKGLPCQPGQPDFKVPPCSGAYPKYEIKVFKAADLEIPLISTMTNGQGHFEMNLQVGDYVIYTQDGPMANNRKQHKFRVEKDQMTTLKLSINTGIL
ncbi:MAG TPA: hypothetical protein ENJ82_06950 [Bacteroidetes bacterium]|nr:hypothetical protein [Bacteroidota bacterium]